MTPQTIPLPPCSRFRAHLSRHLSLGLPQRLLVLAALFTAELLLLSIWLDNASLATRGGIAGFIGVWGAWAVRGAIGFAVAFSTFAYLTERRALTVISSELVPIRVRRSLLAAHVFAMAVFGALSWALYGNHIAIVSSSILAVLWLAAGVVALIFALSSLVPLPFWSQLLRETGSLWALASVIVVVACVLGSYARALWQPAANLTFVLAKNLLRPFVHGIIADPVSMALGTDRFSVIIAPQCSGFEGVGLILTFSAVWLWLFRRECRFPHALLLIPAGVIAVFLLNAVRIAALILIGNAGAPQIAVGGFHSQAGWIAFNAVALGYSVAATRLRWFTRIDPTEPVNSASSENDVTTYLLPFLTILAVGMITSAASSDLEWLYPLRFLAAAAVLLILRKRYRSIDWRFTWFGPLLGVVVFAFWIGCDLLSRTPASGTMPQELVNASSPIRIGWIVFRVLAAVVTVPIAEELAFRGFLLRRLIARDFVSLPPTSFTWLGLGVSSVAFGLLHGQLWLAGTIAGLLYAWALVRKGRLGEAVIAHATTNALLAAYVLFFHQWHLW